jgi:hypothetical protein
MRARPILPPWTSAKAAIDTLVRALARRVPTLRQSE